MATKAKTENGATPLEAMASVGNESVKENFEKMTKGFSELSAFNKETVEALVSAASAATKSAEALSTETVSFSKQSFEDAAAAAKAAMTSRSMQELLEINADFTKSAFDSYMGQMNKVSDMMIAATKDTTEPLTERFTAFVELCQSYRP